ncbi:zinc-finger homeodomain protein 4-like [Arachis duranensis]|uniref:Zinc-finger homeodomain protein 4-like n=1 Tax=Arachis duranensis TaxID=130453 RepID=A0A6P4BIL3_ARADU|nr:zinc-finger homeodomain protein 4-like [Arachis duranensis]
MEPNNYNSSSNVVVTDDVKKPLLEEKKMGTIIRYKECLKNHAASLGGNATDGCGEFMPCGQQGTIEALICSACNCHRNFHRKEIQSEAHHHKYQVVKHIFAHSSMSLSDQSYDHDHNDNKDYCEKGVVKMKKRFRTKFTQEQKAKMLDFAEKAGWKIQKLDESMVNKFCQDLGIKRRVLKVWMHNNKNSFAAKNKQNLSTTT